MPKISGAEATVSHDGRDFYRALLEQQWRAQLDGVTRLSLELTDAHSDGEGPASAGALDLCSVTRRLLSAARVQLEETEAALCRLGEGRYGICAGCFSAIPRARLEALPTARVCVTCVQAFRGSEHSGSMPGSRTAPASVPR